MANIANLQAYADSNSGTAPTLGDYTGTGGVNGVNTANLAAINSALASGAVTRAQIADATLLQALVNSYNTILSYANGAFADTGTPPTAADYTRIGVVLGDAFSTNSLALLNTIVGAKTRSSVDTIAELQTLVNATKSVQAVVSGASPSTALTLTDLQGIGLTGVTAKNLPAIASALAAKADDGSATASLSAVQALVTSAAQAQSKIEAYANNNGSNLTSFPEPSKADFASVGLALSDAQVTALNSALKTAAVVSSTTDTPTKLNTLTTLLDKVQAMAGNAGTTATLSKAELAQIGVVVNDITYNSGSGSVTTDVTALVNEAIKNQAGLKLETVQKLDQLASVYQRVMQLVATGSINSSTLTVDELKAAGLVPSQVSGTTQSVLATIVNGGQNPGTGITGKVIPNVATLKSSILATLGPVVTIGQSRDSDNAAYDSGFSVPEGANVSVTITANGQPTTLTAEQLAAKFDIATVSGKTSHTAKPGAFTGTESIVVDASLTSNGLTGYAVQTRLQAIDTTTPPDTDARLTTDSTDGGPGHSSDGYTNSGAITAPTNKAADANIEYRVTKDGVVGQWQSSYTTPATDGTADGVYKVEVHQKDGAGNTSTAQSIDFTLDTVAPSVSVTELTNPADTAKAMGFSVSKGATVKIFLSGSATELTDSEVSAKFNIVTSGSENQYLAKMGAFNGTETYTVQASQKDLAGNAGSARLDNGKPLQPVPVQILAQADTDADTGFGYHIGFQVTTGATLTVKVGNVALSPAQLLEKFMLSAGSAGGLDTYTAKPNAFTGDESITVDASVNYNGTPINATPVSLKVDTTATTPVISPILDADATDHSYHDGFSVDAGSTVTLSIGGNPVNLGTYFSKSPAPVNGKDEYTAIAGQFNGTEGISVSATFKDHAGNVGTATPAALKIDNTATTPVISATADADATTPNTYDQGFEVETGSVVTITVNERAVTLADYFSKSPTPVGGKDVYTAKTGQFVGTETVVVNATHTDAANNTGRATAVTLKTIDTTAPTLAISATADHDATVANTYDEGFTVETGSVVTITVGGSAATLGDYFAKSPTQVNGKDVYTAIANKFVGTEAVVVSATLKDGAGNSSTATPVALKKIDTTGDTIAFAELANGTDTSKSKGFSVTAGAAVSIQVQDAGEPLTPDEVLTKFTITHDSDAGLDVYTANIGAFDGTKTITVTASSRDAAHNLGINTQTTLKPIQFTTPEIVRTSDQNAIVQNTYHDGFSIYAGANVTVKVNNVALSATELATKFSKSTANGLDTYKANDNAFTGQESITVDATVTSGGTTVSAAQVSIRVDTTAPAALAPSLLTDTSNDLANNAGDKITSDPRVQLTGTQEDGGRTEYRLQKGTDAFSSWSNTYRPPVTDGTADGDYTVQVRHTDAAGNTTESQQYSFKLDTQQPAVPGASLIEDTNGGLTGQDTDLITSKGGITFTGLESTAKVEYQVSKQGSNGDWSVTSAWGSSYTAPSADGTYKVEVKQKDAAGNQGSTKEFTFTLDNTAPDAAVDASVTEDNAINLSEANDGFTVSGTTNAEAGQKVSVWISGDTDATHTKTVDVVAGTHGTNTWTATFQKADLPQDASHNLTQGDISFEASVKDQAGNTGNATGGAVTVDTVAEPASVTSEVPANLNLASLSSHKFTLGGNVGENGTVTVVIANANPADTVTKQVNVTNDSGTWSIDFPTGNIPLGDVNLTVSFMDARYNAATTTQSFAMTVASTTTLSGKVFNGPLISNPGGDLMVEALDASGAQVGTATVTADGSYTMTLNNQRGVLLRVYDKNTGNADIPQYMDEATATAKPMPELLAVVNAADGADLKVNISPLTHMAALIAGVTASSPKAPASATNIHAGNTAVAQLFLNGDDLLSTTPETTVLANGQSNAKPNLYGVALHALSQLEQTDTKTTGALTQELVKGIEIVFSVDDYVDAKLSQTMTNKVQTAIGELKSSQKVPAALADTLSQSVDVNDAPVRTASSANPGDITINEDSANGTAVSLGLSGLDYSAVESGQSLSYAISIIPSFLKLYKADGTTEVTTRTTGLTLDDMRGLMYKTVAHANGSSTVDWTVMDSGGTLHRGSDTLRESLTVTVNAVNDAPVATGSASLAAIDEDTAAPAGATVSSLFAGNFSDSTDDIAGGSSANTLAGIAISSHTADASKGQWQYSTDGNTWTNLASATASAAITLKATDLLRFVPAPNHNGAATALSANLIDTSTTVTSAATVNLGSIGTGGSTAYSSDTVALTHTINPVNDAPVATGSATLSAVNEDTTAPLGASVSSLFGSNFSDSKDAVSGGSSANTLAGIAISSHTANASKGLWQYSTDGTTWNELASTTASTALTLKATDLLRFVPAANFNGAATALSANLIESGATVTSGATVNVSSNGNTGGSTAYSTGTVALSHNINPVNDAPTGALTLSSIALQNQPITVSNGTGTNALADIDGMGAISYKWQALIGSNWTDIAGATGTNVSPTQAQVGLRLRAVASYTDGYGTAESVPSTNTGIVTNVNDAPVNTVPAQKLFDGTGTTNLTGLSVSDPDGSASATTVTLALSNGILNVGSRAGVTLADNGTASVKLTGTASAITSLLGQATALTYTPGTDYTSQGAVLTMTTSDGALSDVDTFTIAPQSVFDATPTLTLGSLSLRQGLNGSGLSDTGDSRLVDNNLFNVGNTGDTSKSQLLIDIKGGQGFGTSLLQNSYFYRVGDDAPVKVSTIQGDTATTTETTTVNFSALARSETVTVGNLTLTAGNAGMTAAQVAGLFASLANNSTAGGSLTSFAGASWSGSGLSGWTSGAASSTSVTFTSTTANTNVTDLSVTGKYTGSTINQGDGTTTPLEIANLTFGSMLSGDVVQVGGLSFTASRDLSADEVAKAFSSLSASSTGRSIADVNYGNYSGTFSSWFSTNTPTSGNTVIATSRAATTPDLQVGSQANRFSVQDVTDGKIGFYYNGAQTAPSFEARVLSSSGLSKGWNSLTASWRASGADSSGGKIIFGDGSGASTSTETAAAGGQGGGGSENLVGTAQGDVIFGDGSGGSTTPRFFGSNMVTAPGRGGSGHDTIAGGAGDDILFGDGFAGTSPSTALGTTLGGAGGYGGAGAGMGYINTNTVAAASNYVANTNAGVGAGMGASVLVKMSTSATLATGYAGVNSIGVPTPPLGQVTAGNRANNAAPGSSVSANGNATGQGDENRVDAYLTKTLYDQVSGDVANSGHFLWGQVMGMGHDSIDGGAGQDTILAGYGNDTITGGEGNDTMWGRGGAEYQFLASQMDGVDSNSSKMSDASFFSFTELKAGASVMIGGLTLKAKQDMTAQEVAAGFSGLNSGTVAEPVVVKPADTAKAEFTGSLDAGWSSQTTSITKNTDTVVGFVYAVIGDVPNLRFTAPVAPDNDTFAWKLGDAGTSGATDTLRDFTPWNGTSGDKLDISKLLTGYTGSNLSQWVTLNTTTSGATKTTTLSIDIDGAGAGTVTQVISLVGVDLSGYSVAKLVTDGILLA